MKIYVASSWRNKYQPEVVTALIAAGHKVYDFRNPAPGEKGFAWSDIDPNWEQWTPSQWRDGLEHPIALHGLKRDFYAMHWADVCVLVMPCGRSAYTEAGWMKGAGKTVYALVIDNCEPDLMYKVFDGICVSMEELIENLIPNKIKCDICNKSFDPSNLSLVLLHQHEDEINPSIAMGTKKGRMIQKNFTDSANVSSIRYNYVAKIMQVEFKNQKKYNYFDVPVEIWDEAIAAVSIGSFMAQKIKGNFRYEYTDVNILDYK